MRAGGRRTTWFVVGGLFVALVLAGVVSNFASADPDGLDAATLRGCTVDANGTITGGDCIARSAEDHELAEGPLADYGFAGIDNPYLSTGLAGVLGVLLVFVLGAGVFRLARRRQPSNQDDGPARPDGPDDDRVDGRGRDAPAVGSRRTGP
jgi:cobalt/nickel transport protein